MKDEQGTTIARRDFLKLSGTAAAGIAAAKLGAAPFRRRVPADKGAAPDLTVRGERETYTGTDLKYIGMPIGGICCGQVNLGGDGKLWLWDIFNRIKFGVVDKQVDYAGGKVNAGGGANYIEPPVQVQPFEHGFSISITGEGIEQIRSLDSKGWSIIEFTGEYPVGRVAYKDPRGPVDVDLLAFSPFIPLDADDSGLPIVILTYSIHNTSGKTLRVRVGGWMENPVCLYTGEAGAKRLNRTVRNGAEFSIHQVPSAQTQNRIPIVLEDWSRTGYEGWTVEGNAFSTGPYEIPQRGLRPALNPGKFAARSYRPAQGETNVVADSRKGKLISREFTVNRHFIEFWICGGNHPNTVGLRLIIDGKAVRSQTGRQDEQLRLERWDVTEFAGQTAHLEIVDDESGFYGQVTVARISLVDTPSSSLEDSHDYGTMTLAAVDGVAKVEVHHDLGDQPGIRLFQSGGPKSIEAETPARPASGVTQEIELAPMETKTVSFAIAWHFPNLDLNLLGRVGNFYASRFKDSSAVVEYTAANYKRLKGDTLAWWTTWNDSSFPRWFLNRTMASASTLATMTCARFADGRFYGWEGIGCCDGTCGHVWQYAQAVGRLFPSLERTVREMADFNPDAGYDEATGIINFRGEYGNGFAADAQAGYILRTLREHRASKDDAFLKRVYPRAKKALQYLIAQDAGANGILEGRQHNTLDVDLYGPSSWLTSLYLAALRAGEQLALDMKDTEFAELCSAIAETGSAKFSDLFWNGEYFVHKLDIPAHQDAMRIGNGCEADQIMGQGWAHQVGLGRIVDAEHSGKALQALYKYNFLPDVGPFREKVKPGRWYALPGESGLLVCSFPRGDREEILGPKPTWASMYFNECWTGCESEAAAHMIAEGLVNEGLRVIKAVHDRHHPSKRNPWNEVECSDHYARAMAAYGAFITACGFEYHGPKGELKFDPKINPENFSAAFTTAEGWGTFIQKRTSRSLIATIDVTYGTLLMNQLTVRAVGKRVYVNESGEGHALKFRQVGEFVVITIPKPRSVVKKGQQFSITVEL